MASCKEGTRPTLFCPAFCPARKRMRPKKLMMGRRKHFHAFLIDFLQLSSHICSSEKKKEPLTAWRMNPNTHPPLNGKNKPHPLNSTRLFFLQLSPHKGLYRLAGREPLIQDAVHRAGHGHVHAEALRQPVHGLRGLDPFSHHAHG